MTATAPKLTIAAVIASERSFIAGCSRLRIDSAEIDAHYRQFDRDIATMRPADLSEIGRQFGYLTGDGTISARALAECLAAQCRMASRNGGGL